MKNPTYFSYLEQQRDALTEFTAELVGINTIHGNETEAAACIQKKLKAHGIQSRLLGQNSERKNIIADIGRGNRTIMLNGHLDTVPFGDENKWRTGPLSAEIRGDRLYGRGSYDMKGSVAAAVFAAIALVESKHPLKGRLRIVFDADEEGAQCSGVREIIKQGLLADACVVGEPIKGKAIGIGARGCYRFELIVHGKSGHTSRSGEGVNAVTKMAKALLALENLRFKYMKHPLFAPPNITPGTMIEGGTGINVYPSECRAAVDCRLSLGMTKTSAKKQITSCLNGLKRFDPDFKFQIKDLVVMTPAITDENQEIVKTGVDAIKQVRGYKPKLQVMTGGSDGNHLMNAGVPCVITGVDGANPHAENEYVSIRSLVRTAKIYATIVDSYLR